MNLSDSEIREHFAKKLEMPCEEYHVHQTILLSRDALLTSASSETLSKFDFLMQQSRYIKKRWWVLQGVLLLLLGILLQYTRNPYYIERGLGIAAPLFVVLIVPEIWKNRNTNATEIECSSYYSLRQIYAARMILFACVDLMLLSSFLGIALHFMQLGITELATQFLLPFNVTCCICFRSLYSPKIASEVFSILLCIVWSAVWVQIVLNEAVYRTISTPVWWALLAASFLYLIYSIWMGQKKYLDLWEVKPLWN